MAVSPVQPDSSPPILEVQNLSVTFSSRTGTSVPAVRGISLSLFARQTLAVVGESGSGKSVTALAILRLLPKATCHIDSGHIGYGGRNLLDLHERDMRAIRGGHIAMVFQEPMSSLNPVMTIGNQVREAVTIHQRLRGCAATRAAIDSLEQAGITDAAQRLKAYPHQFSGGMRQRVMIAMALACRPKVLLADEPTTALDVTIGARILDLLEDLKHKTGLGLVLITHDLGIVAERADVVCVMFRGRIVEYASAQSIFAHPLHPYTRALLDSRPRLHTRANRLVTLSDALARSMLTPALGSTSHQPWWPADSSADAGGALVELLPQHFVRCSHEHAGTIVDSTLVPRINFRRLHPRHLPASAN